MAHWSCSLNEKRSRKMNVWGQESDQTTHYNDASLLTVRQTGRKWTSDSVDQSECEKRGHLWRQWWHGTRAACMRELSSERTYAMSTHWHCNASPQSTCWLFKNLPLTHIHSHKAFRFTLKIIIIIILTIKIMSSILWRKDCTLKENMVQEDSTLHRSHPITSNPLYHVTKPPRKHPNLQDLHQACPIQSHESPYPAGFHPAW